MPKYKVGDKVYTFPEGTPQEEIDDALSSVGGPTPAPATGPRFRTDITSASPTASSPPPGPEAVRRVSSGVSQAAPYVAFGQPIAAAVAGGLGAAFPPRSGPASQIGQATGSAGMEAMMNRIAPGAGYIPRALAIGAGDYAGGEVGNAADARMGNPQQSQSSRGVSAILSALLGGFGAKPGAIQPPQTRPGDFASGLPEYINRAVQNPKGALLSFIKGDDEVITEANKAFNDFVESRGAVLSQDQLLDAANIVKGKIQAAKPFSGAVSSAEQRIVRAAGSDTPTPEFLLKTMFGESEKGYDPALAADAAVTLDNYLRKAKPELAEQIKNTFFVRGIVYGSLKPAEEGQQGIKKLLEDASGRVSAMGADRAAVGPGGLLNYGLTPGSAEYILDGAKFQKHVQDLGPNLDLLFGKGSQAALEDVAEVMKILDPATGEKSFRNQAAAFLGAGLKYNAHRLMFFTSQLGAGGGGPEIGGLLKGGVLATAAIGGAIKLDDIAMFAVKNPGAIRTLRFGLEQGKPDIVRAAMRNLLSSQEQPFRDPKQGPIEPIPIPGAYLR